ncbi:MAG: hypothetical protein QNJ16_04175 [Rhodobacter sp.]|nr:hypothetical protein [Rhodobacter sp.]
MTRVIVHAGFHKTGTTSLQRYLRENRHALAPWFAYHGTSQFDLAAERSKVYAQRRFVWRRWRFRRALHDCLASLPDADTIVLSRETLTGVMPGHRDWRGRVIQSYLPAAVPLCRDTAAALRARFGRDVRIEFVITTREQSTWIESVYGHLVRSIHLTENFAAFIAQFPNPIDLDEEAARLAERLAPYPTHIFRMEDYADSHAGPATPILDLCGVPDELRTALPPAAHANARQSADLEAAFIRLNRSGKTKADLRRIKDRMRAAHPA